MICTVIINATLGISMVVAFLFCIGDLNSAIASPTQYDFIYSFMNATRSHAGTSVMTAILIVLVSSASFGFLASASRLTWAIARDLGTPFSRFISKVAPVPLSRLLPLPR